MDFPASRVLITGGEGYVGSALRDFWAEGNTALPWSPPVEPVTLDVDERADIVADIRDVTTETFGSPYPLYSSVVHLAGVSFSPAHDTVNDLVWDINVEGTRRVVAAARQAHIPVFVLASSASVYEGGRPLRPVSAYARSKLAAEAIVTAAEFPAAVILRKATLCGLGPRPRWDLVVNAMAASAAAHGRIYVGGDGTQRRPLCSLDRAVIEYATRTELAIESAHLTLPEVDTVDVCETSTTIGELADWISDVFAPCQIEYRPHNGRVRDYELPGSGGRTPADIVSMVEDELAEIGSLPDFDLDTVLKEREEEMRRRFA